MMRAAVYRGIDQIVVEDVPVPSLEARELLVRIAVCGVCGTDLKKIHLGLATPPRIFGHEMAGIVAAVGSGMTQWQVGQRVVVNHHVPCLREDCYYCQRRTYAQCPLYKKTGATAGFEPAGGGFAEYVRVLDWCAAGGIVAIPDGVSDAEASFVEPLNTCLKGIRNASIQEGDTILILGQGPIGLLFTQLAKLAGAQVIATDRYEYRLEMARNLGADIALDPDSGDVRNAVQKLSAGRGADAAIIAVANAQVVAHAFDLLRPGGRALLFAQTRLDDPLIIDAGAICLQEKTLLGSYSSDITLQDEAANLIFSRKINVCDLISHTFPLEEIATAIEYASLPRENSLKIMVAP